MFPLAATRGPRALPHGQDVLDYGDPKFRRFESWIRRTFGDDAGFNLISAFARVVTTSSFSQISVRGLYRVPTDDALVVCVAPHNNQFVDPLMCFATMPRPISFVAARVSCDAFWLGRFSLLARAIPVRRAQDYRKSGKGVVFQPDPANPTLIRGIDTAFTELQIRGGIVLPGGTVLEITKIISDTECEVKSAPSPAAAALLTPENPSSYKTQPYENQENVYSTVHAVLQQKGAIGIFAEGGSHDRTSLLPFKAGVAVMSLGAMAANPGLNVKILVSLHPKGKPCCYFWLTLFRAARGSQLFCTTQMALHRLSFLWRAHFNTDGNGRRIQSGWRAETQSRR